MAKDADQEKSTVTMSCNFSSTQNEKQKYLSETEVTVVMSDNTDVRWNLNIALILKTAGNVLAYKVY